jgi:hypothetical protein
MHFRPDAFDSLPRAKAREIGHLRLESADMRNPKVEHDF